MKILIVGAGFGGLALAAYLQRDGHAVSIVEKNKDRKHQGFVIGLWSNGMHTLEPFGVVERVQQRSIALSEELIRDKTGKIIAKMDYRPLSEQWGKVYLLLHSDLQEILRELCRGVPIHFETTVSTLKEQQHAVSVTFNDSTQAEHHHASHAFFYSAARHGADFAGGGVIIEEDSIRSGTSSHVFVEGGCAVCLSHRHASDTKP